MLSYRLINGVGFSRSRSFCPKCNETINWFDNIPIISWILLRGKCRNCKSEISFLYPFVEIFSATFFTMLTYKFSYPYFLSYFIFFSSLIVTIRSDFETMLISRLTTLYLIPLAFVLSLFNMLPISPAQVIAGALFGYLILFCIGKIFSLITKKNGMGQGDLDLLAFIGSFTGILGCWLSLALGSIIGSFFGILLIVFRKMKFASMMPFGPFLAMGAILYVLYSQEILNLIWPY